MKEQEQLATPVLPGMIAGNLGEPIRLAEIPLDGISAGNARAGEQVKIFTRMTLTSDDSTFHKIAENLCSVIEYQLRRMDVYLNIRSATYLLMVIRNDNSAELWVDTAAVALEVIVKRDVKAGTVVFDNDIADIVGMNFPLVDIRGTDRIICLFREGWRFGLFFDFNPDRNLSIERMRRDLGALSRNLSYRHLYDALADESTFEALLESGWFPFVEIINAETKGFINALQAGFGIKEEEAKLLAAFSEERLDTMLDRWLKKPHFAARQTILRSAIRCYLAGEWVAVISIVMPVIEGILNEAYKAVHGRKARIKTLLEFATSSARHKSGGTDTLLLTDAFTKYLSEHTFANFDPAGPLGIASSRHAVSHGAADPNSYTQARALQALLALDQFAFYT